MRVAKRIALVTAGAALLASAVALPATAAETGNNFQVASSVDDVHTGLNVVKGQAFSIKGLGEVTYGEDWSELFHTRGTLNVDATGHRRFKESDILQEPKYDSAAIAPTAPVGSLIYRIGDGPWAAAPAPYLAAPEAMTNGELILAVNDVAGYRYDNTGSFDVEVQLGFDIAIGK